MIKIFYNKKIILLSEKISDDKFTTKIMFSDKETLQNALNIFLNTNILSSINIYGITSDAYKQFFADHFIFIQAAGGIVRNLKSELLLIKRLGFIDLPKGKLEVGESSKSAAVREVCEECGIKSADIILHDLFAKTYHIYPYKNSFALKETLWFNMDFTGDYELNPQIEENITEVIMVNQSQLSTYLKDTYPAIKEILED
ncbi:MAG: NUDIX domain-containing protein [Bacteroidales bacterium]|nr:NUDIX domain-containing protein [Bacteroidales bacterium]